MNIVPASLGKRTGAAILDIFVTALLWFGLLAYAVQPIFNALYQVYDIQDDYQAIQVESKLYVENVEYLTVNVVDAEDYPTAVYEYYTVYKFATDTQYTTPWYNEHVLLIGTTSSLFEYAQTAGVDDPALLGVAKAVPNPDTLNSSELSSANVAIANSLTTFYANAYTTAVTDLNAQRAYFDLATRLSNYFTWELVISTAVSLLIFYLLIPMLFKDGKTLGKKVFGLALVNKAGYKVSKLQIFIRFLAFAVIEVFGSVYTLMGTILISYTIMIFGKKNMSLHDFLASTRVIDAKHSVLFKNADEAAKYEAEVGANTKSVLFPEPLVPSHETIIDGVVSPVETPSEKPAEKTDAEAEKNLDK